MKASWSKRAERDLIRIGEFIERDNVVAAAEWVHALRDRADAAAQMPRSGREVPEFGDPDTREVFLGTYRIVYKVVRGGIEVLAVFEGSMRMPRLDDET